MNIKVDPNAWFHAKPAPENRSLDGELNIYRRALGHAAVGKTFGATPTKAADGAGAAAVAAVTGLKPGEKIAQEHQAAPAAPDDPGLQQMAKRAAAAIAAVNQSWKPQ